MNYFAVQVRTRDEGKFMALAEKTMAALPLRLIFPRRMLKIRRRGKYRQELAPLFPGYIFLFGADVPAETYWKIKKVPGFFRFLKSNYDIQPLSGEEKELLVHFLSYGEIVKSSTVVFDEDSRIQVLNGPMQGLEGRIVKVDKRKGRAKIKLDMYGNSFLVDVGIEIIEKIPEAADAGGGSGGSGASGVSGASGKGKS
ncbi:MAG: antiterminator LoaP [Spirochaetales bacterium]|jgi:transcriptional antiterminator NusG|nr:antiterminator LoaP [Spirochaetales bacterium]